MSTPHPYLTKLTEVLLDVASIHPDDIAPEKTLAHDLGIDSIELLDIIQTLEEEFDLSEIPDARITKLKTVQDVLDLLVELKPVS